MVVEGDREKGRGGRGEGGGEGIIFFFNKSSKKEKSNGAINILRKSD